MSDSSDQDEKKISNQFVRACAEGRHDDVLMMLEDGADVNQFDEGFKRGDWQSSDGHEPNSFMQNGIQMALRNKDIALLKMLDEAGADFDFKIDGQSIEQEDGSYIREKVSSDLMGSAAQNGFLNGALYLVAHKGYSFKLESAAQGALLLSAIDGNDYEFVRFLIEEQNYDAGFISERNQRPLTKAVNAETDNKILALILSKNIDPNYDSSVHSLYKIEFAESFKNDVDELFGGFSRLKRMRDVMSKHRNTPLSSAVFNAVMESPRGIVSGALDEEDDFYPERYENALQQVKLLLQYGADPDFIDENGVSAMDYLYDDEAITLGLVTKTNSEQIGALLREARQNKPEIYPGHQPPKPSLN